MSIQRYTGETVLEAVRKRMSFIFDSFESIVVSISGGKDSTALAHLALTEAHKRDRRVGLFLLDEEVLYQSSVDQVEYLMEMFPDNTKKMWAQFPFLLTNATSITEGQLQCWEPGKHKDWMRSKREDAIKAKPWEADQERFRSGYKWLDFYGAIENYQRHHPGTAFLVGLRAAGESPNRWRAVTKHPIKVNGTTVYWGTHKDPVDVLYPLYDWNFHDVWHYIHQENLKYSKVYDWQFRKGYSINEMRVSSLIHERSFKSICDLPEFEPKTYEKLLKRIKGISLAQEAGRNAKLFKCRKLPKNYKSWIQYRDFLVKTHSDRGRVGIFERRFSKQLNNEYVARQQCRQLILNDYENNLSIDNKPDPRDELIEYYRRVL